MKKKIALVILTVLIVFIGVFGYFEYKINTLDFSLLTVFSYDDYRTQRIDFPSFERSDLLSDEKELLLYKKSDGTFFGAEIENGNTYIYKLDENLNITESTVTGRNVRMIYEYDGNPLMLCKDSKVSYSFILYDFSTETETVMPGQLVMGESGGTRVHAAHGIICAQYDNGDIYVGNFENGVKKTEFDGSKIALLGIRNEKTVLVFEILNDFFNFGRIYEYDVVSKELKHLRFGIVHSNSYCTVSPDGKYFVSHKIVRPDNICSPVVYDLDFPVGAVYRSTDKGYNYIQWIY